jgi:hypothetical protein
MIFTFHVHNHVQETRQHAINMTITDKRQSYWTTLKMKTVSLSETSVHQPTLRHIPVDENNSNNSFQKSMVYNSFYIMLMYSGPPVGIATGYGLDGPGIESRWGRDFSHSSRPALGHTQPSVQWVQCLSRG